MTNQPVSSAELTGLWRCLHPKISHDTLSEHLISNEAKRQSVAFIDAHQYPLIARKISARAGHIFNEALRLIDVGDCDSIISFACGYSMLGFLISQAVHKPIKVIDTDLEDILADRQGRFKQLPLNKNQTAALSRVEHTAFDIEKAASEDIDLASFFAGCKRPVVILEGITYFLKPETRDWMINALQQWHEASVIIDYWSENSLEISEKLKKSFEADLNKDFKENLKSFMLDEHINALKAKYDAKDIGVGEAEAILSSEINEPRQLVDQNEYYPIRIFTGASKVVT